MRPAGWAVALLLIFPASGAAAQTPDLLMQARELYNNREFDLAIAAAADARQTPALADRADLIAARAYLERYRQSAAPEDLRRARERLRRLNPLDFDSRERPEFILGLGQALYFDESYGAAADIFASVLDGGSGQLTVEDKERVLDWWAIAVDRDAWTRPEPMQLVAYQRIRDRMRDELTLRPSSPTANYWLAAAARSYGDLQDAWDAVEAGWLRALLAMDRGAALRAALDELMLQAIVPERARALAQPVEVIRLEWESFKDRWKDE